MNKEQIKQWWSDFKYVTFPPIKTKVVRFLLDKIFLNLWFYGLILTTAIIWYLVWFVNTQCEAETINIHEARLYIFLFFLALAIIGFSALRLYNAIVINTGVNSKLMKSVNNLSTEISTSTREAKQQEQTSKSHSNSITTKLTTKIDSLITALNTLTRSQKSNTPNSNTDTKK